MKTREFVNKDMALEEVSDIITDTLHLDGYDKILVDVKTNSKDLEDRLFRIKA